MTTTPMRMAGPDERSPAPGAAGASTARTSTARRPEATVARPGTRRIAFASLVALAAFAALPAVAIAGDSHRLPPDMPASYTPECGSCHAPYPPGLLPRASWARVMSGLDRHYGTDASLDAALRREIEAWLLARAGTGRKVSEPPPEDRITRAAWFERKHRRVEAATWRLPSVKTAANCAACHTGAEQGDYDDDRLRLPEGASRTQRRAWSD